jgi:hypothetical protein
MVDHSVLALTQWIMVTTWMSCSEPGWRAIISEATTEKQMMWNAFIVLQ